MDNKYFSVFYKLVNSKKDWLSFNCISIYERRFDKNDYIFQKQIDGLSGKLVELTPPLHPSNIAAPHLSHGATAEAEQPPEDFNEKKPGLRVIVGINII